MSVFSNVDALKPSLSGFPLSHTVDLDCKIGECIPFLCEEMVPADYWKLSNIIKTRFQPTTAPISDQIDVKADYFFVPNRLIFNEELDGVGNSWEKFISQVPTDNSLGNPSFSVPMPKWHPTNNGLYSLWDYLSLPVGVAPQGKSAPSDLPKRAYNLIWNEYYRDENLQSEVDIKTNEDILFANVSKDYFTSAFLSRQRGPVTGLPVSTQISVGTLQSIFTQLSMKIPFESSYLVSPAFPASVSDSGTSYTRNRGVKSSDNTKFAVGANAFVNQSDYSSQTIGNLRTGEEGITLGIDSHDLAEDVANSLTATSTAFDISDLRLAKQVQMWQERSLRGGVRYTEFLHSFFGVNPRDDRLQRPEYIGGTRSPVIVQDIIQQSETNTTAQGTEAGHLISADGNFVRKYRAVEYGWIIGILRIMPKIKYTNGINRQFLRNTPFDYYFPTFAHLSEQGIYNEEVFATNSESDNLSIWGYTGIYNEMRYKPSRVVAGLRDSNNFLYWTMARKFTSLPNLNGNFISTKYMQNDFMRIFNITDPDITRPCIVHVFNGIESLRPMPYQATPL